MPEICELDVHDDRKILLVARDGAATVGVADIGLSLGGNRRLAAVEVTIAGGRG